MTDLSILNEQNLRVLLGELSDWWRHMMEHQGINETNYFMYDGWTPDSPRPPSELLHLNQANIQHFIGDLTDAHASTF